MHRLPVRVAGRVEEHDRYRQPLAGLGEREQLEGLVERAEPAGKADERLALLHQHQLAGEEVLHAHVLLVAGDHRVGALLERQPDRHADALLDAGALHRRLHDPRAGARDHHPPLGGELGGDVVRLLVQRIVRPRAGRAEHRHLGPIAIRREHGEGVAHLGEGGGGDLQVERLGAIGDQPEGAVDQLLGESETSGNTELTDGLAHLFSQ